MLLRGRFASKVYDSRKLVFTVTVASRRWLCVTVLRPHWLSRRGLGRHHAEHRDAIHQGP